MKEPSKMLKHELLEEFRLMKQDRDQFERKLEECLQDKRNYKKEIEFCSNKIQRLESRNKKLKTMIGLFLNVEYPLQVENNDGNFPEYKREDNRITRFLNCLSEALNDN